MSGLTVERLRELVEQYDAATTAKRESGGWPNPAYMDAERTRQAMWWHIDNFKSLPLARLVLEQADALAAAEQQAQTLRAALALDGVTALKVARSGMAAWAAQTGNARWWRRIDGTPIPNDLTVFIAEAFTSRARAALAPQAGTEGEG